MTFFLGCDVSKTKLDVVLVNEQSIEQWADIVPNEPVAIAVALLTIAGAYPDNQLVCVVESTGILHLVLAETTYSLGIPCRVYNPIITKQQITATVRNKKTDRSDALLIARLGVRGEGRVYTPEPYRSTKYYARGQQQLAQVGASLKRYEQHLRDVLEAELTQSAQDMVTGIQEQITQARKQFTADTAQTAPPELMHQLQSIPGVGPYIAASLIGEIQVMERFTTSAALVAFAGLDPRIRQSGHSLNSTGRLTKRGSPHLRRSLFIAANIARQHDPNFRALYEKKRLEGKSYKVAVCAVARKLLIVIRAVWLRQGAYQEVFVREG